MSNLNKISLEKTIIILDENQSLRHIPEPPGGTSEAPITLCGWCGENFILTQQDFVDCPDCLRVAHYCQSLPLVAAVERHETSTRQLDSLDN